MAALSAKTLPNGYGYEWTGTAYQEYAGQTDRPVSCSGWRCSSPICSL